MHGARGFNPTEAEFQEIARLVFQYTGISLAPSKKELVKRRFTPRLKALGLDGFTEYLKYVESNTGAELPHFCNAITTNLTSFFREKHHFNFLEKQALPALLKKNAKSRRLRLWSAGCSNGPEAYCMAMILKKAVPAREKWDVKVLATDLDDNCIKRAGEGIYAEEEMEHVSRPVLERWFSPLRVTRYGAEKRHWQVADELKALVAFRKLNLIHDWPMRGKFDVIFCRNVFIYFNKQLQKRLLERFSRCQSEGGLLFLGHSESIHDPENRHYKPAGRTIYERI